MDIKCDECGVILVDSRKLKIRSCSHHPLIIEKYNGECYISIGPNRDKLHEFSGKTFSACFNQFFIDNGGNK